MRLNENNTFIGINPPYQLSVIHSSKLIYPREIYQRGVEDVYKRQVTNWLLQRRKKSLNQIIVRIVKQKISFLYLYSPCPAGPV